MREAVAGILCEEIAFLMDINPIFATPKKNSLCTQ